MTLPSSDSFLPSGGLESDMLALSPRNESDLQLEPSPAFASHSIYGHCTTIDSLPTPEAYPDSSCAIFAPNVDDTSSSSHFSLLPTAKLLTPPENGCSPTDIAVTNTSKSTIPRTDCLRPDTWLPDSAYTTLLTRSALSDTAAPQQTSLHLLQRLSHQNSLIRDAWEAERKYLEANRKRAEEVYHEERTIMQEMRETWINEKAVMQREMQALRHRLERLELENATLKSVVSPGHGADILPPGLEGASRRPHFVNNKNNASSRTSPSAASDLSASTPLDPRTQPQTSSSHDFLAPRRKNIQVHVPVIDVHEIDPKLDGIFIKANAVRDTFTQSSIKSSPATSPSTDQSSSEQEGAPKRRSSSKAQTMQALAAGEVRRRTMHAGHTPNHSLSLFPTMTTLDGSITAGQSEATTPTSTRKAVPPDQDDHDERESIHDGASLPKKPFGDHLFVERTIPDENVIVDQVDGPQMEPQMEAMHDPVLKGPLMVKNIPAQDEIFFAQVTQKLQGITHGDEDALPAVIKSQRLLGESLTKADDALEAIDDGSGASFESDVIDVDVPLKMKTTTNFGAPFGVV